MTPKEKAKELVHKFYHIIPLDKMTIDLNVAKQCALIAVDEIITLDNPNSYNYLTETKKHIIVQTANSYWHEVKKEIKKL